jgi:hypothetical protein
VNGTESSWEQHRLLLIAQVKTLTDNDHQLGDAIRTMSGQLVAIATTQGQIVERVKSLEGRERDLSDYVATERGAGKRFAALMGLAPTALALLLWLFPRSERPVLRADELLYPAQGPTPAGPPLSVPTWPDTGRVDTARVKR